jgi:hypothetical protein
VTRLRFFACEACETVYALPESPASGEPCADCAGTLREITGALGGDAYFAPGTVDGE